MASDAAMKAKAEAVEKAEAGAAEAAEAGGGGGAVQDDPDGEGDDSGAEIQADKAGDQTTAKRKAETDAGTSTGSHPCEKRGDDKESGNGTAVKEATEIEGRDGQQGVSEAADGDGEGRLRRHTRGGSTAVEAAQK